MNPTDATFRAGGRASQLADRTPPYDPGVDVSGVIDELGPDTDVRLAVGDRVIALVIPIGPRGGTYAERIVVDEKSVVHAPKDTTHSEASTLLLNALTAYRRVFGGRDAAAPRAVWDGVRYHVTFPDGVVRTVEAAPTPVAPLVVPLTPARPYPGQAPPQGYGYPGQAPQPYYR